MRIYGDIQSGNCYKARLLLAHLDRQPGSDYEWVHIDILAGESRTTEFLARNPNGRIPVLELDDGRCLSESNAILNYLAADTPYLPGEPYARAEVLSWQFFEQYSHEPYIATARFIAKYLGLPEDRRAEYEAKQTGGHAALGVLEGRLAVRDFLVGEHLTIADITLYAYTHVAEEGGFDLSGYPAVQQWLVRVSDHPAHVTMNDPV